jgi:Spy/CpxP family protein refolding chaperone
MNRSIRIASMLTLIASASAIAQNPPPPGGAPAPGPGPRREMGGPPAAEMLLSNVGELDLTDQQVVRLAAIARRSAARRRALTSAMDSARTRFTQPSDSIARRQFRQRMDAEMTRTEEQMRVDQRDAIAVLTPDQQAKAWNMVANRGRGIGRVAGAGRGDFGGRGRAGLRPGRPERDPGMRREEMRRRIRGDEFAPRVRGRPGVRRPDEPGRESGE